MRARIAYKGLLEPDMFFIPELRPKLAALGRVSATRLQCGGPGGQGLARQQTAYLMFRMPTIDDRFICNL